MPQPTSRTCSSGFNPSMPTNSCSSVILMSPWKMSDIFPFSAVSSFLLLEMLPYSQGQSMA